MGQTEVIIDLIPYQLLPPAVRAFAQSRDPPSHRRDMLADAEVEAFDERRIDLPATGRQHLLNRLTRAEYDPLVHPYQAPPAYRLDHLWQGHPAGLGRGPGGLTTGELHPLAIVREQGCHVLLEAVGQKQWDAVRGQHLDHLMDHTLGHGHAAFPDVNRQQHFALGIERRPHPMRGAGEALDRSLLAHRALLECTEHGIEFIELHLREVQVVQEVLCKGAQLLRRLHQPVQHGVGIDLEHPRGAADAQALCEATDDVHDEVDRDALAMDQSAVMLWKVTFTSSTVELPPRAPAGMAVGAQVAQPHPAAVVTARMRTKVPRGVHRAGAAVRGGQRIGPSRRRWSRVASLVVTQRTGRLVRQARKRLRLGGAFALGLRWHGWGGQTRLRPGDLHHDEEPYEG